MNVFKNLKNLLDFNNSHIEHNTLNQWKSEAEESLAHLQQAGYKVDNAIEDLKDYRQYDHKAAFEAITGTTHTSAKVRPIWTIATSAAAAIAVLLAAYFFFRANDDFQSEIILASSRQEVILKDKSEVILDNQAELITVSDRKVKLKGRGFFKVQSTPDKDKFVIELSKGTVTVLGTRFAINTDSTTNEVAVEEGRVQYTYNGQTVILTAGQSAILMNDQLIKNSNSQNTFSWKNQILEFDDTPIEQALDDISKHYKIKILFDKSIAPKTTCLLTTRIKNQSADQMMHELKSLFGITYYKKGSGYIITSIKC